LTVIADFYLLLDGEIFWNGFFEVPSSFFSVQSAAVSSTELSFIGQIALASVIELSMTVMFLTLKSLVV